ncbi:MAG: hypothetical protein H0T47_22345 [Planctomycetaceae bacterium]|nr:hypothetical protein [Planctomycetaceae bacterium]
MTEPRRIVFDELRRISVLACVLLVTLRLFIGWQFLYEGLWKIDTLDTPQPWTSAGYLKSAQGPFRDVFRNMTGDPDDLHWLDQKWVAAGWDAWAERFTQHYFLSEEDVAEVRGRIKELEAVKAQSPEQKSELAGWKARLALDTRQKSQLNDMLSGPKDFRAELAKLPPGVAIPNEYQDFVRYDPGLKRIVVDGKKHLSATERERLLKIVEFPESENDANRGQWDLIRAYQKAIEDVYKRATRLSYKERLAVALGQADPERTRLVFSNFKGTLGDTAPEKIDAYYQELLASHNAKRKRASETGLAFQRRNLEREWEELQELRSELVGPVKALDSELKTETRKLLTAEQLAKGAPSEPWTQQRIVDWMTIGALTVLGLLLIAGLATRAAAVAGAGMLLSFYLVWPPWPGVAEAVGSTEHSFIVNKNLIEVVALLALAAMPTGQWFGLDRLFTLGWYRLRDRRRFVSKTSPVADSKNSTVSERETAVVTSSS